jgi:hypothetical protein
VHWDGNHYSSEDALNLGVSTDLYDISCSAPSQCEAVGSLQIGNGHSHPIAERWNGRGWTIETAARPTGATDGDFAAVSCAQRRSCIAVGLWSSGSRMALVMAQRRVDNHWSVQRIPDTRAAAPGTLSDVSCTASGCMAVGSFTNNEHVQVAWAVRLVGGRWTDAAAPTLRGATASSLTSVSYASSTLCIAVGGACTAALRGDGTCSGGGHAAVIADKWTPHGWTLTCVPAAAGTILNGSSCPTPTMCLAVGQSGSSAVAARWDGSTWSSHTVPTPADIRLETLTGVSCSSASACAAVGTGARVSQDGSVTAELAARWDGSTWAVGELPTPNGEESQLAVSCPAAASCVAVGGSSARRWDGATWSLRSVPVPGGCSR